MDILFGTSYGSVIFLLELNIIGAYNKFIVLFIMKSIGFIAVDKIYFQY